MEGGGNTVPRQIHGEILIILTLSTIPSTYMDVDWLVFYHPQTKVLWNVIKQLDLKELRSRVTLMASNAPNART